MCNPPYAQPVYRIFEFGGERGLMKQTAAPSVPEGRMAEYTQRKKRHTLIRLLKYFRYHKGLTLLTILLATASSLVQVVKPYILKLVIDRNLEIGINDIAAIGRLALLYFAVVLLGSACDYAQSITLASLGQRIMHRMRTSLFAHIQRMNMSFFDNNSSGSLLTRVNSDVESLSDLFSSIVIQFVKDILVILNICGAMLLLDVKLALWCFTCIPLVAVICLSMAAMLPDSMVSVTAPSIFPSRIKKLFLATAETSPLDAGAPPEIRFKSRPFETEAIISASVVSPGSTT